MALERLLTKLLTMYNMRMSASWFGVLLVIMCEEALITPPVAMNLFVVHAIVPEVPLQDIVRGLFWFYAADVVLLALFVAFPQISLWLPSIMMKT